MSRLQGTSLRVALLLGIGVIGTTARAGSFTVDKSGSGDYTSIQAAINASSSGDVITVNAGTYYEYVSFGGKNVTVQSASGSASTIISAPGSTSAAVTFSSSETASAVLDGFTVTNPSSGGRGIRISSASPTIRNSKISLNGTSYSGSGGGAYISGGSPTFDTVTFLDNQAYYGGDVYVDTYGAPTFQSCTFSSSQAYYGAGIYASYGYPEVYDSEVSGQYSAYYGAFLYGTYSAIVLDNVNVHDNYGYYGHGGAVHIENYSTLNITDSDFTGNYA